MAVLGGTHTTHVITTGRILPLVRKQIFNWSQLESEDYDRYLTNLRLIGCPDSTIRDLIVCDVDALYAHRRITDLPDEYAEWWRPEGNTNYYQLYFHRHDQLDKERRDLLTKLLGPDWQLTERYVQRSLPEPLPALTGSILGNLGDDVKNSIYDLVEKFRDRQWNTDNYTNRLLDSKALREQLARILTPPQLEEYLLRYSDTADELRGQLGNLKYFNATPDEFRALFRTTDNLDLKIKLAQYSDDPAEQQRVSQLEQQRTDADSRPFLFQF